MNYCYQLIRNRLRRCLTVVSETARGRSKAGRGNRSANARHRTWWLARPMALISLAGMATGADTAGACAIYDGGFAAQNDLFRQVHENASARSCFTGGLP